MHKEILQLKRDGFCLLKNIFSPSQVKEWISDKMETLY